MLSKVRHLVQALACLAAALPAVAQNFSDIKPSPQQVAWQDRAFGVIVHFGTNTFLDREWGDGKADPAVFNPGQVDPVQWARAVKSAGANYMILVAKHHDGFALWPTQQSDYSVKASPWLGGKGDLVRMTAAAAKQQGLGLGVYLSPWDRHEPRYADAKAYDTFYAGQLVELASGYGPLVEWWLDGAGSAGHVYDFERYVAELRTYQPNAMVFADTALFEYGDIRWVGNEIGVIEGENWNVIDRHGKLRWRPVEVDTPLHKDFWFWNSRPEFDTSLKTVDELMQNYEDSVGRGGQLVLGIAPDRRGLLPDADVKRLTEFGEALQRRYGDAANVAARHARTDALSAAALDNDPDTSWVVTPANRGVLEVDLGKPVSIDRALTMERLEDGQLVRRYVIQAWDGRRWQTLSSAQAIGHMKIDKFEPVTTRRVRLCVVSSVGTPAIREFKLFARQP
ncbi:alpha-L-fucosidase [Roseateles cellulosilyticus]|uniref:alpha-L-fucosidase n=1 Tax=Pelomonas cellulosilytica TaxID=2906762 RepID=A0ABS8XTB9_9BURK|nr:alpha-L-fucosidase [Pelomonas sp. P8]MCE4553919.1 alpha-L-fucosidase [Pelomonas sp. P8]